MATVRRKKKTSMENVMNNVELFSRKREKYLKCPLLPKKFNPHIVFQSEDHQSITKNTCAKVHKKTNSSQEIVKNTPKQSPKYPKIAPSRGGNAVKENRLMQ